MSHNPLQITIGEVAVLIACTAIGLSYHAAFGPTDWTSAPSTAPAFWPYVRWMTYLPAAGIVTPPLLLFAQYRFFKRRGWLNVAEVCWLVVSALWCAVIALGFLGMLAAFYAFGWIAIVLAFQLPLLHFGAAAIAIVAVVAMLVSSRWRCHLRWTDALAIFYLVVLSVSGMAFLDAVNHL